MRMVLAAMLMLTACSTIRLGRSDARVDLNAADRTTLATLPGVDVSLAERIADHRPYGAKEDLLRRNVVTEAQYAALAPHVYVGPPAMPEYLRWVPPLPQGP